MTDNGDIILSSGAEEAVVTLTTAGSALEPLAYMLAQALPNVERGDPMPAYGSFFVNADGFVVMSTAL